MVTSKSRHKKLNTCSSTEVELVTVDDCLPQVLWTRLFLISQGYSMGETIIHQDNKSVMLLAQVRSYQGRLLSKVSIFGCHISKIEKNGEQDCFPFGQSLVEINFRSPFCPLPNCLRDSLFLPQQPTERIATKTTTIKQQHNKRHEQSNKNTTTTRQTTKTHPHNNQA